MDDRKKRVQKSLLDAFGGGDSTPVAPAPVMPPRPRIDPEAAKQAQKSMRKAFGGDQAVEDEQLKQDLEDILMGRKTPPPSNLSPEQEQELMKQIQLEYLKKKSEGLE